MSKDSITCFCVRFFLRSASACDAGVKVRGTVPFSASFTHNGKTHGESPEACPRLALESLPYALLVFSVLALEGVIQEVLILQDLGVVDINMSAVAQLRLGLCHA